MKHFTLKNGKELIIRPAIPNEAQEFLEYVNLCGRETDFLSFGKEGIGLTIEEETKYFQNFTEKNFMLVALVDNKIIGSCSLRTNESRIRLSHTGVLGITILKEYWGIGIGKYLISSAIEKGKIAGLTRIELLTRIDNEKAISLYKKMGFEIEGQIRNAIRINDKYFDNYIMGILL